MMIQHERAKCDVLTSDVSQLYAERLKLSAPNTHIIMPEVISKEPLGPVPARRRSVVQSHQVDALSMANTAPTRPSQIAASNLSKPGRLTPEPERPRSSSMTVTSVQPRARARSARPY